MHPPDPEMQRAARQGDPNCKHDPFSAAYHATEPTTLQARRIARLYAVSFATASTIARLAYSVAR
jgi:hypothetical protein